MRIRLLETGIARKVVMANLVMICCTLVVLHISTRIQSGGWDLAGDIATVAVLVLSFPVGMIAISPIAPTIGPLVFFLMPFNALLWGYLAAAVVRLCKTRKTRRAGDS